MESYTDEYRRLTKMLRDQQPGSRFGWVIGRSIFRTDDKRRVEAEARLARLKRYFDDHGIAVPS